MINNLLDEATRNNCVLVGGLNEPDYAAVVGDNDKREIRRNEGIEGFEAQTVTY